MSEFDLDIRVTTRADTSDSVRDGLTDTCNTCPTCVTCVTCATEVCNTCYYTCLHANTHCLVP
jgi:hypothetical protein